MWEGLVENIRETILVDQWSPKDWKVSPHEARILHYLSLIMEMIALDAYKGRRMDINSLMYFSLPGEGFIKMNFDRASKWNPGVARLGGILRDNKQKHDSYMQTHVESQVKMKQNLHQLDRGFE